MTTAMKFRPLRFVFSKWAGFDERPRSSLEMTWGGMSDKFLFNPLNAHPLRLDYMGLKKRLGGVPIIGRKSTRPAFVELIAPQEECVIEFESPRGTKMRIQWKASTPHDWVSLLRPWREGEG